MTQSEIPNENPASSEAEGISISEVGTFFLIAGAMAGLAMGFFVILGMLVGSVVQGFSS